MEKEDIFYAHWQQTRQLGKNNIKTILKGSVYGLIMGLLIFICLTAGWYQRAEEVANTKMSFIVSAIIILGLGLFSGILYAHFVWETNEQRFLEIEAKSRNKR